MLIQKRMESSRQRVRRPLSCEVLEARRVFDCGSQGVLGEWRSTDDPQVMPVFDFFAHDVTTTPRPQTLDVLANDIFSNDYDGARKITAVSNVSAGDRATVSADGCRVTFLAGSSTDGRPLSPYRGFNYTVDGRYEGSVSVAVNGYLMDDVMTSNANGRTIILDVFANDFVEDGSRPVYDGPRRITAVGESTRGSTISISADRRQLFYTPEVGIRGRDTFSYTVDGNQQATVSVDLVSRVRDDRFRVEEGSEANTLRVLLNDQLGRGYAGLGRITSVTQGDAGGRLVIANDGAEVVYTPAAGFTGSETFAYTVDREFTARVHVSITSQADVSLPQFENLEAVKQELFEDALERYAGLFGTAATIGMYPYFPGGWLENPGGSPNGTFLNLFAADTENPRHTTTNVQVAGVQEGNIVETDGNFIYTLRGQELIIARAFPVGGMEVVSRESFAGTPTAMYLRGDRLTVITTSFQYPIWNDILRPWGGGDVRLALDSFAPWIPQEPSTTITVLDVTDRTSPQIVQTTKLDGTFGQSRGIDNHLFVTSTFREFALPAPEIVEGDGTPANPGRYETADEYQTRVRSEFGTILEGLLPKYSSYDGEGNLIRSGLIAEAEELYRPGEGDGRQLTTVVSLDMDGASPGIVDSSALLTSYSGQIMGGTEHLYLFAPVYSESDTYTEVTQFAWDGASGSIEAVGRGAVAGTVNDQFSADEHDGYLRVATTTWDVSSSDLQDRTINDIWILRADAGVLELVGAARDIAAGETLRSARFLEDRAFIVTFRQIDPLFAIDLSNPESPQVRGEIELPGFSSYLQLVDENHLLGIGSGGAFGSGTQINLFNIADLAHPVLIDQFLFEDSWTWSAAQSDHHAVSWYADQGILAIPISVQGFDGGIGILPGDENSTPPIGNHLAVFSLDVTATTATEDGIQFVGQVTHQGEVLRSVMIEEVLYSIGTDGIRAAEPGEPATRLGEVLFGDPPSVEPESIYFTGTPNPRDDAGLDEAIQHAQTALAADQGFELTDCLLVAAEPVAGGFEMVFRHAERHFRVRSAEGGDARVMDRDFAFIPSREALSWHNSAMEVDVNGDGEVGPLDALLVINQLFPAGGRALAESAPLRGIGVSETRANPRYVDVNDDGYVSPLDALLVINGLNAKSVTLVEGGDGSRLELVGGTTDVPVSLTDPCPEDSKEVRTLDQAYADLGLR